MNHETRTAFFDDLRTLAMKHDVVIMIDNSPEQPLTLRIIECDRPTPIHLGWFPDDSLDELHRIS
jgi:hypothetical protein